jgi:hypothetical protein
MTAREKGADSSLGIKQYHKHASTLIGLDMQ